MKTRTVVGLQQSTPRTPASSRPRTRPTPRMPASTSRPPRRLPWAARASGATTAARTARRRALCTSARPSPAAGNGHALDCNCASDSMKKSGEWGPARIDLPQTDPGLEWSNRSARLSPGPAPPSPSREHTSPWLFGIKAPRGILRTPYTTGETPSLGHCSHLPLSGTFHGQLETRTL